MWTTPAHRILPVIATLAALVASPVQAQPAERPVTLTAPDGLALKATYYAPGKPGPGIVLLHQCNRDRSAWAPFGRAAAARGYHVIAMDYRGYGESGGERDDSFQEQAPVIAETWPGDVDKAYDWLIAQAGVDKSRIAAAGASCGLNQSVLLARRHPGIRTVMLLSGNVSTQARQYLAAAPGMAVLAAASRDDGAALGTMEWTLGWSRNPSNRLVEYEKAGHGTDMFPVEAGLRPLMLDWLDTHLRDAPAERTTPLSSAPPSPVETFWITLTQTGGAARARELFDKARAEKADVVLFPEAELNAHGYQLLQTGNAAEAIVVFRMNVDAYPASANTYDSLADAYLAAGQRDEALRFAEKALAMLAADTTTPDGFKAAVRESAERKVRDLKKAR